MAEIFGKTPVNVAGAFSIDKATMTFSGFASGTGLLVQGIQIRYSQPITMLYDLAKATDVYYVAGRSQGQMTINKMVGSAGIIKTFYTKYGNVCNAKSNNISLSFTGSGCTGGGGGNGNLNINQPVITEMGITMSIEQATVAESVQLMFASME